MNLRTALRALRVSWWLPVLGLALGGAAAVTVALLSQPLYRSSTQLFVAATNSSSSSDAFQGSQFTQQRIASYERLLAGDRLLSRVVDRLGLDMSVDELGEEVTAAAVPNTVLLEVAVTDPSPERAQSIAREIGRTFSSFVADVETTVDGGTPAVKVTVIDAPDLPRSPSEPQTERDMAVGLAVGLVLGGGAAIARAGLDRSVRDAEGIADFAGASLVGSILEDDGLSRSHLFSGARQVRTVEDYRQLATNLNFLDVDDPPRVLMVSSALPAEGKTTVTVNLATALAEAGRRVVVVEADLRRPRMSRYLGLVSGVGLTNVLADTASLEEVTQICGDEGFTVIGAGPPPPNAGKLLASSHMRALLSKLRSEHDFVLIDTPPVLPVADSIGLAPNVDGVLLVVRYGKTRKDQLRQAAVTLEQVHATMYGVVLNGVPAKVAGTAGYGYAYGDADRRGDGGA